MNVIFLLMNLFHYKIKKQAAMWGRKAHAQSTNLQLAFRISNHWKSILKYIFTSFQISVVQHHTNQLSANWYIAFGGGGGAWTGSSYTQKKFTDFSNARTNTIQIYHLILQAIHTALISIDIRPMGSIIRSRLHFEEENTTTNNNKENWILHRSTYNLRIYFSWSATPNIVI